MRKTGSLRGRWIMNTVGVVAILGFLCAAAVTAVFAVYYYSAMESDMQYRARNTTDFFAEYSNLDYNNYYQSCIHYANTFADKNKIELQFINNQYHMVATSYGNWAGDAPSTSDIAEAFKTQDFGKFIGKDPVTGERIMAFSKAMVYSNGEVIGVLRYVTSTRLVDRQILIVAMWAVFALLLTILIVWFSSNYYIRSIMIPVAQITEKAKRIAGGSYGMIIQTKYDDEIGELADTINEMSIQISQNEKMQHDFVSSLSHELRTPLTSITGWSETLLGGDALDPDTRRGMEIIRKEASRLTEMVVELLDFTRMESDRFTLNIQLVDLRSEFEDTVFMYSSRLKEAQITLDYEENDEDIPEISCDPERMRQVFLNLLDNAAKHGGSGQKIVASMCQRQDLIEICIRDFGPGIPEDELPLVKKKFYKGSSKARGTGIGLAVCDEIVAMHGGELIIENAEDGGTRVKVLLPITQ